MSYQLLTTDLYYNHYYVLTADMHADKYGRSQNNINVEHCNNKETTSSYNVITESNFPHGMLTIGSIIKMFEPLKKHAIFKSVINKHIKFFE